MTKLNCTCLMSKEKIVLEITILYCVGIVRMLLLYTLCVKFKSGNITFSKMKLNRSILFNMYIYSNAI